VDHLVVATGKGQGCPSSERIAVLFYDSTCYVSVGYGHSATWLILAVEGNTAAAKCEGVMIKGLGRCVMTGLSYVVIGGVKIVLYYTSNIGLHKALVFKEFSELVSVFSGV
jgi:hypothetical protein